MNLFIISYKFYLFFLLVCAFKLPLLLGQSAAQEFTLSPEILRFDLPAKFNKTPNTSFYRSEKGVVFIGKQNGLLTIDDDRSFFIPSMSPVYVSHTASGKPVYLSDNDFGTICYNYPEDPKLISRSKEVASHSPNFYPQEITHFDNTVFMCTSEGIFAATDSSVDYFFFNGLKCDLINTGRNLYLEVENRDLLKWNGTEFKELLTEDELPLNNFTSLRFFQHILDTYYICSKENYELKIVSRNDSVSTNLYNSGMLPPIELVSVFVDNFNDIWLVYDYSIFKVEYPSKAYTLDLTSLVKGTILATSVNTNSLFISTNQGLFKLTNRSFDIVVPKLIPLEGSDPVHLLSSFDNQLIAAGNKGLFHINNNHIIRIGEGKFSFVRFLDKERIISCNESGFARYNFTDGSWRYLPVNLPQAQIISDAEFENSLWLLQNDNTILKIDRENITPYSIDHLPLQGMNQLIVLNNELLLLGETAVYTWDGIMEKFISKTHPSLTKQLNNSDLLVSSGNHLWSTKKDVNGGYTVWKIDQEDINVPYYEIPAAKQFGQVLDIDETDDYLWITGNEKLIRLDKNKPESVYHHPLSIHSVSITFNNSKKSERKIQQNEKIRFRKNSIAFNLKSLRYLETTELYYRYRLTHYQEDWSEWSRNKRIHFDNLHERDYIFEAQSVSSFGLISEPETFEFSIAPPVYRKWYAFLLYTFLLLTIAFLIYKWRLLNLKKVEFKLEERIREKMATVLHEKEQSDKLVADLFPKGTAEEIKSSGRAKSKKFEMATVLFSDIQGFTKIAEEMNPEVLIDELDKFFFHFDSVVEKYNIEKIKTIGDAYMAAGGIPVKNSSNPVEVVLAGLEMQYYMHNLKKKKADIWDLRIGVHTGPVISGVVGHKKLSYDIWGDTVNTASRMESSGEGGKVNISGMTYSLVKDYFLCEYRGKLPVKYKGNIDMYFVTGLRPELSVDLHGIPNKRFFIKLQMLRLKDVEERIFEEILANLLVSLHFHKKEYILRVCNHTELLARSENLTDDEILITQTAALLLFSGLTENYENYENKSIEIARVLLPEFGYDNRQIDRVCNLILASKEPFNPQNKMEELLIDSKMEYLGRADYITQIKLLYLEKKNLGKEISKEKLIRQQKAILKEFNYFTLAAQRLREVDADTQIENLNSWK